MELELPRLLALATVLFLSSICLMRVFKSVDLPNPRELSKKEEEEEEEEGGDQEKI